MQALAHRKVCACLRCMPIRGATNARAGVRLCACVYLALRRISCVPMLIPENNACEFHYNGVDCVAFGVCDA